MNSYGLQGILALGTMLMCILYGIQMKWYDQPVWKCLPVALALTMVGVVSSKIWFVVENGYWGGRSLYGAIVFSPLIFFPLSKLIRMKYMHIMDLVASGGSLALALVKIQCIQDECCKGMVLYIDENRMYVRFPSQIVEMITFLILSVVLTILSSREKFRGKIFPYFLVLYGALRFMLEHLRETIPSYLFGLSAGSFWSLCSCIIGSIVLLIIKRKSVKPKRSDLEIIEPESSPSGGLHPTRP